MTKFGLFKKMAGVCLVFVLAFSMHSISAKTPSISESEIEDLLSDTLDFGLFTNEFHSVVDFETNIAVKKLFGHTNNGIGNTNRVYETLGTMDLTIHKTIQNNDGLSHIFNFGIYKDKDATQLILETSLTTNSQGYGEKTISLSNLQREYYVYELDDNKKPLKDGEKSKNYQVYYQNSSTKVEPTSNTSYIWSLENVHNDNPCNQSCNNLIVVPESFTLSASSENKAQGIYTKASYQGSSIGTENDGVAYRFMYGTLPFTSFEKAFSQLNEASYLLGTASSSNDVEVVNVEATSGDWLQDIGNGLFHGDRNAICNEGIPLLQDKYLLLNIRIAKKYSSYNLNKLMVNFNGNKVQADNGSWDLNKSKILINILDEDGNPYTGEIHEQLDGTILAPKALL